MERKIYRTLFSVSVFACIITSFLIALVLEKSFIENLFMTLPTTISIIVFLFIGLNFVAHFLTKNIIAPIDDMTREVIDGNTINTVEYEELKPIVDKINWQQEKIEEYIKTLEKNNEYRKNFTANVGHELKTPLTSINGFAEMMSSQDMSKDEVKNFSKIILKEGNRLLDLIDSIIKLSKIDEMKVNFEKIHLNEVFLAIYPSLEIIANKKDITIDIDISVASIYADKRMMEDLISNLVTNAIKYNHQGGHIQFNIWQDEKYAYISIEDTGIGISKENQEKIFERFFIVDESRDKKSSGTGLGLSIVRNIVQLHFGKIKLESEPGVGTHITIQLKK